MTKDTGSERKELFLFTKHFFKMSVEVLGTSYKNAYSRVLEKQITNTDYMISLVCLK